MLKSTKGQIKAWKRDNIHAIFKAIDSDNAEIYGFSFKGSTKETVKQWLDANFADEVFKIEEKKGVVRVSHIEVEDTWFGTEHVRKQKNGVSVRVNVDPSPLYKAKLAERAQAAEAQRQEEEAARAQERMINDKMRELAMEE
jgi:hypothetical protein